MDGRSKQDKQKLPFFVYGTLLPNQPNAFLWQGLETSIGEAWLGNGRLHDMGGYPMLVETGVNPVKGQVITIATDFYESVMARLDFLEGHDPFRPNLAGYRRVVRDVILENGRAIPAWVYIGQIELVNGRAAVPDGDWATYILHKIKPTSIRLQSDIPSTNKIFRQEPF